MTEKKMNKLLMWLAIILGIIVIALFILDIIFTVHWVVLIAMGLVIAYFIACVHIIDRFYE